MNEEKNKGLEIQKLDDEEFQEEITDLVNNADKIVREYEIGFKKALKEGNFLEENPYLEIIDIYDDIKKALIKRGWNNQITIYNNQIRIYKEKLEKHKKIKEIEEKKAQDKKKINFLPKVSIQAADDNLASKSKGIKLIKELEDKEFEENIDKQVDKAERMARDYGTQLKKGNFNIGCPYQEIINIYRNIRDKLHEYGWNEESLIYADQIKLYKNKLEKDFKLRDIENRKRKQKEKLEKSHRFNDNLIQESQPKISKNIKQKEIDEQFQNEIIKMVNQAENLAREYDNKLKKGDFKAKPIYPEVIKIYRKIRKNLLDKGWLDQATIYLNQINIYKQKIEKVQKLREIEVDKLKRHKEIENMHRTKIVKKKPLYDKQLEDLKQIELEKEERLDKAMSIIDDAEKQARTYELKLKARLSDFESPYDKVIEQYREGKVILLEIGWINEANHIDNTVQYYLDKKKKDDKIRSLEKKKKEKPIMQYTPSRKSSEELEKERKIILTEIENKKKKEQEIFDDIYEILNKAENISKKYTKNIFKEGILNLECPYEEVINNYREAKIRFEDKGWIREAKKLDNSIDFYRKKLEEDKKLRKDEQQKIEKTNQAILDEKFLVEKSKREKEELIKKDNDLQRNEKLQKEQFEIQKKKAFDLMDKAKEEIDQNNFNNALDLYEKSQDIFKNLNWKSGINLIRDSIELIKNKKLSYEKEQKEMERIKSNQSRLEKSLEEEIKKINETTKIENIQKEKERKLIQELKIKEEDISKNAYNLLKIGTKLIKLKKFDDAYKNYLEARKLFTRINWDREVAHINQDLLFDLNKKREQALRLEKYQKKKEKEEEELRQILNIAEEQKKELKRIKVEERRKILAKGQESLPDELEIANILIKNYRYNEVVLKLSEKLEKLKNMNKIGKIDKINTIIESLKEEAQVPLIVLYNSNFMETKEFKKSYEALDRAQKSIIQKKFMKAVSELNEAKYNLEKINIENEILVNINNTINNYRNKIGNEKNEISEETKEIKELDNLKLKIAQSRADRRKRIEELKKR
ncbi:MAG: hypothetical protein KGD63_00210 [Candidatus Lokiarchaeota archaeon]|nr:hypothetical protein [Candidatus Lokiarchaeota archaeon]